MALRATPNNMIKDVSETFKEVCRALTSARTMAVFAIAAAFWFIPFVHGRLPLDRERAGTADFTAIVVLLVSGASLAVHALVSAFSWLKRSFDAPGRSLKKALKKTSPTEKLVLKTLIARGVVHPGFDTGSEIGQHLASLGLLGLNTSTREYFLPKELLKVGTREPNLFDITEEQHANAFAEIQGWQRNKAHREFFSNLSVGYRPDDWLSRRR